MGLTKGHVLSTFAHLISGNSVAFFANVVEDVHFTVTGSSHQLAREWFSKETYINEAWKTIGGVMREPMKLSIASVLVDASDEGEEVGLKGRAVVELKGEGGVLKSGKEYNNEYCWVVGFNADGLIESVRAYLDSALLRDALEEGEAGG